MKTRIITVLLIMATFTSSHAQLKSIELQIDVKASVSEVWKKWTTLEGAQSFLAQECVMDVKPMGLFEVHWFPNNPKGQKGAENVNFLALQENKMISFTWDAPWTFPEIRKQRTVVIVRFEELDSKNTRVHLTHTGWGEGKDWDTVYNYFIPAWGDQVLPYLKYSLEVGPVDWANRPTKEKLVLAKRN